VCATELTCAAPRALSDANVTADGACGRGTEDGAELVCCPQSQPRHLSATASPAAVCGLAGVAAAAATSAVCYSAASSHPANAAPNGVRSTDVAASAVHRRRTHSLGAPR
jgi:hypothetical protein